MDVDAGQIARVSQLLAFRSSKELEAELDLEAGRADILPAGMRLSVGTLQRWRIDRLRISAWGLRHGMVIAAALGFHGEAFPSEALARRQASLTPSSGRR